MRAYLVKSEADFTALAMKRYLEELVYEKKNMKQSKGKGKSKAKAQRTAQRQHKEED